MDTEAAYNQALDYLYSFVDYSLKKSSELAKANFNLDRMRALTAALGSPEQRYAVIHIAGTKGKGSTSALAASALQAAGYRTGLYTSPHLQDYVERIQVDGKPISHEGLTDLIEELKPVVARIPNLTTFEITTALGFLYFARQDADAAVIEVGLGGRLDATNVVAPQVTAITSLSYDHMAVLGNTLAAIAGEKAGIIKEGRPVISSPQKEEAFAVLERVARERHAEMTLVGRDVLYKAGGHSLDGQSLTVCSRDLPPLEVTIPLLGSHQVINATTACAALRTSGLRISDEAIRRGFAKVYWPCRFEIVRREPPVILDSAHNVDSAEHLRQTLDDYFPGRPVTLIFGSSEDKDILGMLTALKPRLSHLIVTQAVHPRALALAELVPIAHQVGLECESVSPVEAALVQALELSEADGEIVLSAGSMFVTAEVRTAWQKLNPKMSLPIRM
jgi:dihydrofolate synthase/folylpolyglutamate synthase